MKKIMSLVFHSRHHSLYRHAFHVYRDWAIILGVATIALIGVGLVHGFIFYELVFKEYIYPTTTHTMIIDRAALGRAVEKVQQRSQAFVAVRTASSTGLIDPSQ